jgi:type II secretory pathway pseudopilin PulG
MKPSPTHNDAAIARIPESEEGYVLLIAIFFLAILVLSLAVAAPQVAKSIQRDRELETYRRGMQYRRAIQLYYRSFHAYPPNIDALVKTNNIRFLRKRYIDPITGKDDWKPIMFGQNKTPTAMGFFGQPLSGNASTIAGTGPGGGNSPAGSSNGTGSAFGGSAFGGSSFGGSSFGGSPTGGSSIFGSSDSGGSQTPSTGSSGSTTTTGTTGSTPSATGSSGAGSSGSSSSGSDAGLSGQTFGGAGIIGYEPASPKQSILIYKKKNHFNEWEFTYDPLSEMKTMGGGNTGAIGQPASSTTTPVGGPNSPTFGGPGNGPGSSPNPTPAPMPPDTSAPQ